MAIFPEVKHQQSKEGYFIFDNFICSLPEELSDFFEVFHPLITNANQKEPNLFFSMNTSLKHEEYLLSIEPQKIIIEYHDYRGAINGFVSLVQLKASSPIPCQIIHDYPDLSFRGVMLDISRDKIPTLETLKQIVQHLMMLKVNQLQLYVEGLSMEFPSLAHFQSEETPFTLSEYRELESYAKIRGIDLIGNLNSFGHMTKWLAIDEFHHLAECEDGFIQWGFPFPASTLNPLDDNSFQLVKKLYDDFLPNSSSPYFNINCDEPFELGRGKSKETCEIKGIEYVYLDFVQKLIALVKKQNKTPMMWGDVLINHPEVANKLPKDIIFIDWGYDRQYDFANHAKILHDLKLPFILAPGTSTWNSFTGRYQDMITTTKNAAINAKKYQGIGVLMTDWGDNGHLQYFPWSYLGIAYMVQSSWGENYDDLNNLHHFLNHFIFYDSSNTLSQSMQKLSTYNDLESQYIYNGTMLFQTIMYVDPSERFPFDFKKSTHTQIIQQHPLSLESMKSLHALMNEFHETVLKLNLNSYLKSELLQTENFMRLCLLVNAYYNYPETVQKEPLIILLDKLINNHEKLWLKTNKPGGLQRSLSRLLVLKEFINTAS